MTRSLLVLLALLVTAGAASAQPVQKEVVILTSFPKEMFEAYKQGFEQKVPGVRVIVKQQQTNQAVTYLRETRGRPEADIFWVSAVDAFQTLKTDGLLDKVALPKETLARIPARLEASRSTIPTARTGASRCPATVSCGTRAILRCTSCRSRASGPISPTRATSATS
jgi:ABC-type glycerol-3-phosphate transport system substrate-binding protein